VENVEVAALELLKALAQLGADAVMRSLKLPEGSARAPGHNVADDERDDGVLAVL
jgi:hypothetical protein